MAMTDKRLIKVGEKELDHYAFCDGSMANIRDSYEKLMRDIREEYGFTIEDENVEFDLNSYERYGDTHIEFTVKINRFETSDEVDIRLAKHKRLNAAARKGAETRKKKKELKEKIEYERLKKKFEPNNLDNVYRSVT